MDEAKRCRQYDIYCKSTAPAKNQEEGSISALD